MDNEIALRSGIALFMCLSHGPNAQRNGGWLDGLWSTTAVPARDKQFTGPDQSLQAHMREHTGALRVPCRNRDKHR